MKKIQSLALRWFGFDATKHSFGTEVVAGMTTFITMAYILAVNPLMMADAGMDQGAAFVATALSAVVGTFLCAVIAKMPFAQAPAMGPNAFFAYTICLTMGYSWQFALTGVLLEGILFIILSATGVREWIVQLIPDSIKIGIGAGIGILIAFLGLESAGIVVSSPSTLVTLGDITQGTGLLAMLGLLLIAILLAYKVKGALLIGMAVITIVGIPMGLTKFEHGIASMPPSLAPVFCQFEWKSILSIDMLIVVLTLLSMDMFDTVGTLLALGQKTGKLESKTFNRALLCDAIATTVGAALGTSTVGTYVESSTGIQTGGRSGLTSVVTAFLLLLSLFLAPLFLSIPAAATGPALFLVGMSMIGCSKRIVDNRDVCEMVPALITMLLIPLTFSIANGIILGMISYCVLNIVTSGFKRVSWQMLILTLLLALKFVL